LTGLSDMQECGNAREAIDYIMEQTEKNPAEDPFKGLQDCSFWQFPGARLELLQ
jgi:hypothetical protein